MEPHLIANLDAVPRHRRRRRVRDKDIVKSRREGLASDVHGEPLKDGWQDFTRQDAVDVFLHLAQGYPRLHRRRKPNGLLYEHGHIYIPSVCARPRANGSEALNPRELLYFTAYTYTRLA